MLLKFTTAITSVFAILAVVACNGSNEVNSNNSESANIDLASQYPVERIHDAIWVLFEGVDADGTTLPVQSEELYSLKFGGPGFFSNGKVEGFRRCNALNASVSSLLSSTLSLNEYSTDGEYCGEDELEYVDQLFDNIFLSETNYKIDNNVLTIVLVTGEALVFKPSFDERFQNKIITLLDDSTIRISFEDYIWIDYDVGIGGDDAFSFSVDILTDEIKAFIGTMKSTPIYVKHLCPDEIMSLNGETFFLIQAKRVDGETNFFSAGITCGTNRIGSRRFLRSDVLELKSMLEKM